eukprot:m.46174 g.46174  ORF g.46174 m.46174 type:complete len:71 (+) comp12228_c1_seq1:2-214(+)
MMMMMMMSCCCSSSGSLDDPSVYSLLSVAVHSLRVEQAADGDGDGAGADGDLAGAAMMAAVGAAACWATP